MNNAFLKIWIIIIFVILITSGILIYQSQRLPKPMVETPKEEIETLEEKLPEEIPFWKSSIEVFTKPEPSWEVRTDIFDIFIRDEKSGKETFLMRLDKVCARHYHFAEYHNGNLYIIREFGYDPQTMKYSEDYIRELWKYDKGGAGKKLFSAKGIDFRVDPNEKFVAIESGNILRIIDLNTNEVKLEVPVRTLTHPDLSGEFAIGLEYWSGDGKSFWGKLAFTAYPKQFFKVDTVNWKIIKYNVSSLNLNIGETALNPNLEKIVYSDAPVVFDVDSAEEFKQSQQMVTLYLYDLNSERKEIIDTSTAEWFSPRWLDNETIEYSKRGKKIIFKISL